MKMFWCFICKGYKIFWRMAAGGSWYCDSCGNAKGTKPVEKPKAERIDI